MYVELITAILNTADVIIPRVFLPRDKGAKMFVLPQFPITCNIWRVNGVGGAYVAPDLADVPCNLAVGERVTGQAVVTSGAYTTVRLVLLLPPLTDIRAVWGTSPPTQDLVECPSGSKRFYTVNVVDDYGKGFPNEHRFAIISYDPSHTHFGFQPPVPLP